MKGVSVVSRIAHGSALLRARPASVRWWDTLPADFASQPEPFLLEMRDWSMVAATAATDVLLRSLGAALVGGMAFPLGYHPFEMRRALKDIETYGPIAEAADPDRFFARPKAQVEVRRAPADRPRFSPEDGIAEDLHFESPFVPFNPRIRRRYLSHRNNAIAHARLWRHHRGPRPTVIAVHGFSADLYRLNEWFFALPRLYELGCDVLLFTLPFHGKRQTRISPFSGHGFFAGGPATIVEAFAQAVFDLRVFLDWLLAHGSPGVGITGVSLGGYTASLLASVDERLAFAIPNVPVISLPDLVLEWEPIGSAVRASLALFNRTIIDARHLLAASSPLTYVPRLPKERLMIIGGVGDRLAPPKHSRLLWEHWGRCRIHWFPGSHLIHLDRGEYLDEIALFLDDVGFLQR